jgi:alpha(1,3/1,4) fucosyltransferase
MDPRDVTLFIDPVSHHFVRDEIFNPSSPLNRDNCHAPYFYMQETLRSKGIEVHTADYLISGEKTNKTNVYFSFGTLTNYEQLARRRDTILSGFITIEAPIVQPSTYKSLPKLSKYFKRLFSYSTGEALARFGCAGLQFKKFFIPQPYDRVFDDLWRRRDRKFLTMISSNRLPRIYWNELYTERHRALEFFSQYGEIDLYGNGWDHMPYRVGEIWLPGSVMRLYRYVREHIPFVPRHPIEQVLKKVYKGSVKSKYETMSQYNFALCYENMFLKGWLNEKIFDAFYAGTIPIYWGATDVTDYIPENSFIDKRKYPTYADLRAYLKSLSEKDIQTYRENARDFLASEEFKPFSKESFARIFTNAIEEDLGLHLWSSP